MIQVEAAAAGLDQTGKRPRLCCVRERVDSRRKRDHCHQFMEAYTQTEMAIALTRTYAAGRPLVKCSDSQENLYRHGLFGNSSPLLFSSLQSQRGRRAVWQVLQTAAVSADQWFGNYGLGMRVGSIQNTDQVGIIISASTGIFGLN